MKRIIFLTNSSKHLNIKNANIKIDKFIDGEISIELNENLKGKNVFVIGSTQPPSENLIELLFLIDTASRKGAKKITAIIPYFGYARSDKEKTPDKVANGITILKMIEMVGGNHLKVVTQDLHSQTLRKLFTVPIRDVSMIPQLAEKFKSFKELAVIAPDKGAEKKARKFAREINNKHIFVLNKKRLSDSKVEIAPILGNVGKNAVIVDDMVSSGNTLIETAKRLRSNGVKNIYVAVTHMVYQAGGWNKLSKSPLIKKVYLTNTICPQNKLPPKFEIIDITPTLKRLLLN